MDQDPTAHSSPRRSQSGKKTVSAWLFAEEPFSFLVINPWSKSVQKYLQFSPIFSALALEFL
jgi:hypothetical protein